MATIADHVLLRDKEKDGWDMQKKCQGIDMQKRIITETIGEKRKTGRPRKKWMQAVMKDIKIVKIFEKRWYRIATFGEQQ